MDTEPLEFKLKELEETSNVMRCELLARVEASHSINFNYQQLVDHCLNSLYSLSNYASRLIDDSAPVTEYRRRSMKNPVLHDLSNPMALSELESEHSSSISRLKELESSQLKIMAEMKNDLQQPMSRMRSSLEELFNVVKDQDQHIGELKHSIIEVSQKLTQQKEAETEQSLEIISKLKQEQKKLKEQLEETKEVKDLEKSQIVEQLKKEQEQVKTASIGVIESTKRSHQMEKSQLAKEKEVLENSNKRLQSIIEELRNQFDTEVERLKQTHRKELEALNISLLGESETLKSIHAKKWEEMTEALACKEKEGQVQETANRQLKEALRKTQGDLEVSQSELSHTEEKLSSILDKLPKYKQDTAEVVELRAHVDELRTNETQLLELIRHLQQILGPVYDTHKAKHKDWSERHRLDTLERSWRGWAEVVLWADFCSHAITKLSSDNLWLVDRLTEFGRELERTKIRQTSSMTVQTSPPQDDGVLKKVWKDVKSTATAFKEFEEARYKLVERFKTSHL
jgi:myosin heavy subunit